jgi:hypothetical protein
LRRSFIPVLLFFWLPLAAPAFSDADQPGTTNTVLEKFLETTASGEDALRGASMKMDITASVPKLQKQGHLSALRIISKVGQITYRSVTFQGDNTIKNQVIARYLEAEKQGAGDQTLSITPANYKFKFKGRQRYEDGHEVYVFQLTPHRKKVGLFKGDLWVDVKSCLPVVEKGRWVKNPSIFFKKVDFERDFTIQNGLSILARMNSTIDTRLFGKVLLNVHYSDVQFDSSPDQHAGSAAQTVPASVTN